MSSKRIFYSLLERVGSEGHYQNLSLIFWSLIFMTVGASTFFNTFLFYSGSYICPDDISINCKEYVCNLPMQARWKYEESNFSSLATKFGDYRCEKSDELNKVQSFIYLGGVFGVIVGAMLNQYLSKKKFLIITVFVSILGMVLAMFGPTLFVSSIGLFINYAAKCIQNVLVTCFITETVAETRRGKDIMVIYFFYAIGVALNGLVFYAFDSWQQALLCYQIVPFCIILAALFLLIEETPFDQVIFYSPAESLKAFGRIALRNGRQNELTIQEISQIKEEYLENEQNKHDYAITVLDLFRFKSLRIMTIISFILHFLISFEFNAPEMVLEDYAMSVYLNGAIIGFSEVCSSIFCYFFVDRLERKKTIYVTSSLGMIVSSFILVFASCNKHLGECEEPLQIMQTIGLFIFRVFVTITYNFFYITQFEMFPTQIRSLALQTTAVASYLAVALTPAVQSLFDKLGTSIIITFCLACLLVIFFTVGMPQTYKIQPPEMIKQLQYEHYQLLIHDKIEKKNG